MTGIDGLSGGNTALDTPTLEPYPYPSPMPSGPESAVPQYPPYIPEQDMNTSSGTPRSTLDGIHDDGGVVIKPPGELGPPNYPMGPRYAESPPGSGVWVPDQRPYPPGSVVPADWSGEGAEQAEAANAALQRTREAMNRADEGLGQSITDAHAAAAQSKMQLQQIQQEIRTGIAAMQPSLGTAAGREQLAQFLDQKASEAKQVVSNAQEMSTRLVSNFQTVGHQFLSTTSDPWDWDGETDESWMIEPIDPGGAAAGPGSIGPIPQSVFRFRT